MNKTKRSGKHFYWLISVFALMIHGAYSQDIEPPKVLPPSPNSAILGKFGEIPVGTYTGIPNISIPLYTIEDKDLIVPISLNYHAGGLKVEEQSSWVGAGWSLQAGGTITRSIRGLDDLGPGGYLSVTLPDQLPDPQRIYGGVEGGDNNSVEYTEFAYGIKDGEPDMFHYSVPGASGKFVLESQGGALVGRTIPYSDTKINISGLDGGGKIAEITITTPNGHVFFFDEWEEMSSYTRTDFSSNIGAGSRPSGQSGSLNVRNSWYLKSISSSTSAGNITFEYSDNFGPLRYEIFSGSTEHLLISRAGWDPTIAPWVTDGYDSKATTNVTLTNPRRLEKIKFDKGSVVFVQGANYRCDINGDKYLKSIMVLDNDEKEIERHEFEYFYDHFVNYDADDRSCLPNSSHESPGNQRLFLKQITGGKGSVSKPPYFFQYDFSESLPHRFSLSKDYWGHYNGAMNSSLMPYTYFPVSPLAEDNSEPAILGGGDRSPSLNYTKLGTLNKIIYPTGGSTEFQYELNQAANKPDYYRRSTNAQNSLEIFPHLESVGNEKSIEFEIMDVLKGGSYLDISGYNFPADGEAIPGELIFDLPFMIFIDKIDASGNVIEDDVFIVDKGNYRLWEGFGGDRSIKKINRPFLTNGRYRLTHYIHPSFNLDYRSEVNKWYEYGFMGGPTINHPLLPYNVSNNPEFIFNDLIPYRIDVAWDEYMKYETDDVGGLRVHKVLDRTDENNVARQREFRYTDANGGPSGYLTSLPFNLQTKLEFINAVTTTPRGDETFNQYTNRLLAFSGTSFAPLNTTNGSWVGYSQVEELEAGNGKTVHNYTNPDSHPDRRSNGSLTEPEFPYPPVDSRDWQRGLKEKDAIIRGDATFARTMRNVYEHLDEIGSLHFKNFQGIKISPYIARIDYNNGSRTSNHSFKGAYFNTSSGISRVTGTTTTVNENAGEVTTAKTYAYTNPNHLQITSEEFLDSKNRTIKQEFQYPLDYAAATRDGIVERMIDKNLIHMPIEKVSSIDGVLTGSTATKFELKGQEDIIVPETLYSIKLKGIDRDTQFEFSPDGVGFSSFYEPRLSLVHDDIGNITEVRKTAASPTRYFWGYNDAFPVIEVSNSEESIESLLQSSSILPTGYSSLEGLLASLTDIATNQAQKDRWEVFNTNLRNNIQDQTLVTTYTYNRLIGVTSMTDPRGYTIYYEYDDLNRLKAVKNAEGNLVTDYEYNYKNQ
ncbi:hypothetical protein [Maribacter sp. 2-571]|uniref:hypothetical protein n=1 Tax=Maribacter sp. 2-571 TaxID=3417569 RepID=UPI003D33E5A9